MRWLVALLVFLMPATAQAGTLAREGTELVYRSVPGDGDYVVIQDLGERSRVQAGGTGITLGAGCNRKSCSTDGVTAVRVFAADGNDQVEVFADLPVFVDLGPGDDVFVGQVSSITISGGDGDDLIGGTMGGGVLDGGPGDDRLRVDATDKLTGPQVLTGGAGDDEIRLQGLARADVSIVGGDGDDELSTAEVVGVGPGVDISCGPGDDRVPLGLTDRPGDGCAPRLTGITPRTVSRRFDEGALAGPGAVAVTLYRDTASGKLAEGFAAFTAAGPLRLPLKATAAGRRYQRPDVGVKIRTRYHGDVNEYWFFSRLVR